MVGHRFYYFWEEVFGRGGGWGANICFKYELILGISVCWLNFNYLTSYIAPNYLTISHQIFVPIDVSWNMETRHPFVDWKTLVHGRCQSSVFFFNFVNIKNLVKCFQYLSNLVEFTLGKNKFGQKNVKFCPRKNHQFQHQIFFFSILWCWKKNWIFQWNHKISHIYTWKTKLSQFCDK
jgi:hypothetical protein